MKTQSLVSRTAVRAARRARRFGADAVCVLCGFSNPIALILVSRTLLEEHHVYGANNDDNTRVPLCRNCHALVTEGIQATGATMRKQRSLFEQLAETNLISAVFYRAAAESAENMAAQFETRIARLDRKCPDWRAIVESDHDD